MRLTFTSLEQITPFVLAILISLRRLRALKLRFGLQLNFA